MLALQRFGVKGLKLLFYILQSFPAVKLCLAFREMQSSQDIGHNRNSCRLTDTTGNHQALVVASLLLAFLGKRNRNDCINAVKEAAVFDFAGKGFT